MEVKVFSQVANPAYKNADEPIKLIQQVGIADDGAKGMFGLISYPTQAEEQEMSVGEVSPEDLGQSGSEYFPDHFDKLLAGQIFGIFQRNGFLMLPQTKIAKLVSKEHKKIKPGDSLPVYMEPIEFRGYRWVFVVDYHDDDGKLWVVSTSVSPGFKYNASQRWFVGLPQAPGKS